jgi:hypothetical protein
VLEDCAIFFPLLWLGLIIFNPADSFAEILCFYQEIGGISIIQLHWDVPKKNSEGLPAAGGSLTMNNPRQKPGVKTIQKLTTPKRVELCVLLLFSGMLLLNSYSSTPFGVGRK